MCEGSNGAPDATIQPAESVGALCTTIASVVVTARAEVVIAQGVTALVFSFHER